MELVNDKLKALTVILRTSQVIQEVIRKDLATQGLNLTEFAVLELLYHKGDQPIQVIGKKILISSSSITYVVDKLEEKKYVVRKGCPQDRRVTYAAITDEGKKMMDQVFPRHAITIGKVFDQLQDDEVSKTIELLKRIGYRAEEL